VHRVCTGSRKPCVHAVGSIPAGRIERRMGKTMWLIHAVRLCQRRRSRAVGAGPVLARDRTEPRHDPGAELPRSVPGCRVGQVSVLVKNRVAVPTKRRHVGEAFVPEALVRDVMENER
jgi:hypothetical protein